MHGKILAIPLQRSPTLISYRFINWRSLSVAFNSGQKMALKGSYFINVHWGYRHTVLPRLVRSPRLVRLPV